MIAPHHHEQPGRPKLVSAGDLPEYQIGRDERLPELAFVKWIPSRWLNSSGHLKCTYEVQGVARALFDISTAQSPIGTLPDDDEELAKLLRLDLGHWRALRALGDRGPLRNWSPCLCPGKGNGEVRLMHEVVTALLLDVLHRREQRELSKEAQAEGKRYQRMIEGLKKAGLADEVLADGILMTRIDRWLKENCTGNRTPMVYLRAIEHAHREGWFRSGRA